jgi:hypothetical protein
MGEDNLTIAGEMTMMNISEDFKKSVFKSERKIHGMVTVYFANSLRRTFTDKELFSLRLLEKKDFFDGQLSAGNIGSNQLEISFNNSSRIFDKNNPDSELYGFLQSGKRVDAYLGLELQNKEIEWVSLGVFWSGEWEAPEDKIWCKTLCIDRLALLDRTIYETGQVIPSPAVTIHNDDNSATWLQGILSNVKLTQNGKLTLDIGGET